MRKDLPLWKCIKAQEKVHYNQKNTEAYDLQGTLLKQLTLQSIHGLPEGDYFLRIFQILTGNTTSRKFEKWRFAKISIGKKFEFSQFAKLLKESYHKNKSSRKRKKTRMAIPFDISFTITLMILMLWYEKVLSYKSLVQRVSQEPLNT